jgi:hypothetical protein
MRMPRSKEEDYRKNAADSLELAQRAVLTVDKSRLLGLAEAWLDLADREVRRRQHGPVPLHQGRHLG